MNNHKHMLLGVCIDDNNTDLNCDIFDSLTYIIDACLSNLKIKNSVDLMFVTTKDEKVEVSSATSYMKYKRHICRNFLEAVNYSYESIDKYYTFLEEVEVGYYIPILFIVGADIRNYSDIKQALEKNEEHKGIMTICINYKKNMSTIEMNNNYKWICSIDIGKTSDMNNISFTRLLEEIVSGGHKKYDWSPEEQSRYIRDYIDRINRQIACGGLGDAHSQNEECVQNSILQTVQKDMDDLLKSLQEG